MKRVFIACTVLTITICSCNKSSQPAPASPFLGHWQWYRSTWGPVAINSSPDTTIFLNLNAGNQYNITLNGALVLAGTYQSDSSAGWVSIRFNNIDSPAGNNTRIVNGNVTYLRYNYTPIGPLVMYQLNASHSPTDSLYLIQDPINPEARTNYFKRFPAISKF